MGLSLLMSCAAPAPVSTLEQMQGVWEGERLVAHEGEVVTKWVTWIVESDAEIVGYEIDYDDENDGLVVVTCQDPQLPRDGFLLLRDCSQWFTDPDTGESLSDPVEERTYTEVHVDAQFLYVDYDILQRVMVVVR